MKAFSTLQVITSDIPQDKWDKLMRTMYFNMVAKIKLPKNMLHLEKHPTYSHKFKKQVTYSLPLDYHTLTHHLTMDNLMAFVGLVNRVAYPATAFHLKSLIKRERQIRYHLTPQQIKLIIDETLFNQSIIDGLKLIVSTKTI